MSDPLLLSPVRPIAADPVDEKLDPGTALCLSGGGFRAMLFHAGALWRMNELGLLKPLKRVSSVSGGSITAGVLGLAWTKLDFDGSGVARRYQEEVVAPIRNFADKTFDWKAVLGGFLLPGSIGDKMIDAYRDHLFGNHTLQDLPDDAAGPRFVLNATNLQSGVLWRFSRPYAADYLVGRIDQPTIELAVAVAASAAFPPILSPVELTFDEGVVGAHTPKGDPDLHRAPFTTRVVLTDGGVYDNLGLETVWKKYETVFVSDGGGHVGPDEDPADNWATQVRRVLGVIDSQVRALRKRQIVGSYQAPPGDRLHRNGAYWAIWTPIEEYGLADTLACATDATTALAETATRLHGLDPVIQERLINWGYAACDASLRCHFDPSLKVPTGFPYPASGVA
ncbi:MAG TPA: patatin-like phospholipase family protein [Thermomicrobiales bacterium]